MKQNILLYLFILVSSISYSQTLLIYGYDTYEEEYSVYLGKLNASEFDSESIWNEFGKYGSEFSSESIWNEFGKYGNDFSSVSPFNELASYPPILVDKNGDFYGYFSANKYKQDRCNYVLVDIICELYEKIREDVDYWYDKIFD